MKQNGRGRDEGNAHRGRGKSQGSSGGYQGSTNQYNQNDNYRQTSNKKRGTGQGPLIYNGPKGNSINSLLKMQSLVWEITFQRMMTIRDSVSTVSPMKNVLFPAADSAIKFRECE